jgi:cellulose synthase/poly-beta-1,6-N-acetylglucosamine synthase-like glycosyltransferase
MHPDVAVALLALAGVFMLLATHPFLTYPLSLRLASRRASRQRRYGGAPLETGPTPSFAICVCAYNEAAVIERKLQNMLELRERVGSLDILVYVDAATDGTAELLEPYRDLATIIVSPERRGKTHGMNLLVGQTDADVVLFTDANVMIDREAIPALARQFADPSVGCVCGHLSYVNEGETPTASVGSLYWRLEEAVKRMESGFGAVMGADGSLFAIRRSLHRAVPDNLIDDMYLSLSILADGYRVVSAEDALAYEESVTSSQEEFRRKVRIACQAFNVHRRIWPRLRRLPPGIVYMYASHKLLRWLSIFSLAFSGLFAGAGMAAAGVPVAVVLLFVPVGFGFLWLGAYYDVAKLASVAEILISLAGAGLGVLQSLRGRQFQTWTPAASIRRMARK